MITWYFPAALTAGPNKSHENNHRQGPGALGRSRHENNESRLPNQIFLPELEDGKMPSGSPTRICKDSIRGTTLQSVLNGISTWEHLPADRVA